MPRLPRLHRRRVRTPEASRVVTLGAALALAIAAAAAPASAATGPARAGATGPAGLSATRTRAGLSNITARQTTARPPCPIAAAPPLPGAKPPPPAPSPPPRPNAPAIGGDDLATDGLLVPDGAPPLPRTLNAHSWVLADMDTGEILAACAPHARHQPASTQKLLTVLAALPKLNLKQVVTITDGDLKFERGSSAVGLVKGGKYTVETILLGLLLNSGNDAANVIARLGGGSEGVAGTIKNMNAEAKRIGALDTTAVTPSGLDAPGQFTSAYDLALIARADFDLPDFRRGTATERTVIPAQPPKYPSFQIQNDNKLLTSYSGAIGGKTGFTDIARHTYMGAAQRGGRRLVVTMLRGEHRPQRLWQQGAALLDWGFKLPRDTPAVGKLVRPEDLHPAPKKAPGRPGGAEAAALGARPGRASFGAVEAIGIALGAGTLGFALLMAGLTTLRWRRRRRASRAWPA